MKITYNPDGPKIEEDGISGKDLLCILGMLAFIGAFSWLFYSILIELAR